MVISCETIEHLIDPQQAVREMARVCKKEGLLYLTTPNYLNLMGAYHVYDLVLKRNRQSPVVQPIDHYWIFPGSEALWKRLDGKSFDPTARFIRSRFRAEIQFA